MARTWEASWNNTGFTSQGNEDWKVKQFHSWLTQHLKVPIQSRFFPCLSHPWVGCWQDSCRTATMSPTTMTTGSKGVLSFSLCLNGSLNLNQGAQTCSLTLGLLPISCIISKPLPGMGAEVIPQIIPAWPWPQERSPALWHVAGWIAPLLACDPRTEVGICPAHCIIDVTRSLQFFFVWSPEVSLWHSNSNDRLLGKALKMCLKMST